jgi:amino acid transporter
VPVFGLDALGSAAYGPEAALTVLIPLGLGGLRYIVPLSAIIVTLLLLVYFSYRQTIDGYPAGGGAYTVAGQNLGRHMGLLAGASLLLDYLLNVSVGISTGIGALISAVPRLQPHTLGLCLLVLGTIVVANLRGVRDTGVLRRLPTLCFVASLLIILGIGFSKMFAAGGHPISLSPMPHGTGAVAGVGLWLLLQSFASGCTALTGVEASVTEYRPLSSQRVKTRNGP